MRQIVHHIPDSHLNCYIGMKRGSTEPGAGVLLLDGGAWSKLPDYVGSGGRSIGLLAHLHARRLELLNGLSDADWLRSIQHPGFGELTVDESIRFYAWHGRHHVAQITMLRERMV